MTTKKFEGPYGLVETAQLIPRWTYPIKHGQVKSVSAWELNTLENIVTPVRMINDIHVMHNREYEDNEDAIDLDEDAEALSKTESRLLIKPRLNQIRARGKQDHISPENVFDVDSEVIDQTIDTINDQAAKFRRHFLDSVFSPILGYDIAAGEAEAIARDCLKTDLEIDSELVPYIERIGLANIIGSMMEESKSVPEAVRADVLKDWLIKSFDDIRADLKGDKTFHKMKAQMRRLMHGNDELVAKGTGIGTTRGMSEVRNRQKENGQA